jgi:hypothetical protein
MRERVPPLSTGIYTLESRREDGLENCPQNQGALQLQQFMNMNFVEDVLRRNGLGRAIEEQEAVFLWRQIAGDLGSFAEADYVENGILHLTASSSAAAQEITLHESQLLERLNRQLTHGPLRKLRIRASGLARKPRRVARREVRIPEDELELLVEGITDAGLRERFVQLYKSQRSREASLLAAGAKRCPLCGVVHTGRHKVCAGCLYDSIEESSEAD